MVTCLPLKNVGTLVPWQTVHTNLIGPYSLAAKTILQTDGLLIKKELSLSCMTIDPTSGWFEIVQVPNCQHAYVKSSTRHGYQDIHDPNTLYLIMDQNSKRTLNLSYYVLFN